VFHHRPRHRNRNRNRHRHRHRHHHHHHRQLSYLVSFIIRFIYSIFFLIKLSAASY
jgi:hypothetical protein